MQSFSEDFSSQKVLAELFTRYIGHGCPFDAKKVAFDCGCSLEAIYAARKGLASTDLSMKILRCLPDEANQEFMRRCLGYTGGRRIDANPGCFRKLHSASTKLAHVLARAFEDGRVDAREERELLIEHLPPVQAEITRVMGVR